MKVGIIGCGNIGSKRALSMAKDKSCKIKYIVGRKKLKKKSDHIGKKIAKKLKTIYYWHIEKKGKKNFRPRSRLAVCRKGPKKVCYFTLIKIKLLVKINGIK